MRLTAHKKKLLLNRVLLQVEALQRSIAEVEAEVGTLSDATPSLQRIHRQLDALKALRVQSGVPTC